MSVARLATLPPAARRVIALSLLVLALLVAWVAVVLPVRTLLLSQGAWRADSARQIARDRGVARSAAQILAASAAVDASPLRPRLYETGGNGAVSPAAALQNDLRAALIVAGVEPTNFRELPGSSTRGLRVHRVEFSSTLSVDQLQAFFLALDRQPHYVRVERLRLDAPAVQRADENPRVTALQHSPPWRQYPPLSPTQCIVRSNHCR